MNFQPQSIPNSLPVNYESLHLPPCFAFLRKPGLPDPLLQNIDLSFRGSVKAFIVYAKGLDLVDGYVTTTRVIPTAFSIKEGLAETIKVNVISTFLLVQILLPKLRSTSESYQVITQVETVTPEAHHLTQIAKVDHDSIIMRSMMLRSSTTHEVGNRPT